jgi:hypothetical protein
VSPNSFDLLGHAGWVGELGGPFGLCWLGHAGKLTWAGLHRLGGPSRSHGLDRLTLWPYSVVRAKSPDWVAQTRSRGLVVQVT